MARALLAANVSDLAVQAGLDGGFPAVCNGQTSEAAQQVLIGSPFLFDVTIAEEVSPSVAKGRVIRTEPAIGSTIPSGSAVTIVVSGGGNQSVVPDAGSLLANLDRRLKWKVPHSEDELARRHK